MRALAVRTSEGNGTAPAPCSATKSVSSISCATRPFGTGRSPRVHLEPSLGSTPSKYESRYGVRPSSARSDVCAWEVAEAVRLGKRIIPVLSRSLENTKPPRELADRDYVYFYAEPKSPGSGFGPGLLRLASAL